MSNKDQTRLGTSPGGMYGNRNFGATQRDLGAAMGMVAGGPGKLPPEGVQSMATKFINDMASAPAKGKPGGPKPFKGGNVSTAAATGYGSLEAAFDALEGKDAGVKLAAQNPQSTPSWLSKMFAGIGNAGPVGSAMGGTAGGALQAFTDYGVQSAADNRMLAAGNIYADPMATASLAPTDAQAAVVEAMAYAPRQRPRPRGKFPGVLSNAGSMAGGKGGGNAGSNQGGGSAWGVSGSRPTGGGAGGERTGDRAFDGK
jgi:hypothetical protein